MVVRAAGDQVEAVLGQRGRQRLGVGDDLVGVVAEGRLRRLVQRDRDAGGGVVVRTTLQAGEDRLVDRGRVLAVAHEHRAARTAQRLVRRRRDDVGVADRRRVRAADDQAGDVRDVGDQQRADLAGDLGERREVDGARDRRTAADDHLRALGQGELAHVVHVDAAGVRSTP